MEASLPASVRPQTQGMRWMLLAASILVLAVGVPLFLVPEQTDRYFAWTIASPLTATFLGACYWSAFVLELLGSRERSWAYGRVAVPAVLIFTGLTLVVTLLHLDRFHFTSPALITRLGTWVWLAVYASVPVIMSILLIRQLKVPGADLPRQARLPNWARIVLMIDATIMLVMGVALFVAPLVMAPLWPWELTALTGRAIGAWLLGLGVAAAQTAWENDLGRARIILISAVAFCALQFITLARYPGEIDWSSARVWIYLLFLVSFLAVGAYGWFAGRQLGQRSALRDRSVA
jgi:hypothetical protein